MRLPSARPRAPVDDDVPGATAPTDFAIGLPEIAGDGGSRQAIPT